MYLLYNPSVSVYPRSMVSIAGVPIQVMLILRSLFEPTQPRNHKNSSNFICPSMMAFKHTYQPFSK